MNKVEDNRQTNLLGQTLIIFSNPSRHGLVREAFNFIGIGAPLLLQVGIWDTTQHTTIFNIQPLSTGRFDKQQTEDYFACLTCTGPTLYLKHTTNLYYGSCG